MEIMVSNIFGGGNTNFLYTPMSEDEREVLQRLIESDDLEIEIANWGIIKKFKSIRFGDLRLQIVFSVHFSSPQIHIPVTYFDMSLKTRSGILLYREKQPVDLLVGQGVQVDMCWDIAIREMDPNIVKMIKPGARGLTTREGNMRLDSEEAYILENLRRTEKSVRKEKEIKVADAEKKSVY